jgi:hypothetical protein
MLPAHDAVPLKRVVGALEDELPNLDEGRFTLRVSLFALVEPIPGELLPQTSLAIDTADLLLEDGGVPFGVELDDHPTGLVQVETFTTDLALRNEDPRRSAWSVERGLEIASRLPLRRSLKESRVEALTTIVVLEKRA